MTEPTYRIETSHDVKYDMIPWSAHVYRLTDDTLVGRGDGMTESEAVNEALALIARLNAQQTGSTYYATEHGARCTGPAVTPESRRA